MGEVVFEAGIEKHQCSSLSPMPGLLMESVASGPEHAANSPPKPGPVG
jgi:hypothetical protein